MVASCDPAEVSHIEREMAQKDNNIGVGVIDVRTGSIRLFTYDETDTFSLANPLLQVMAGHEAAAAMSGIPFDDAKGFVLGKQGADWHVFNQSHLNRVDSQRVRCEWPPRPSATSLPRFRRPASRIRWSIE